MEHAQLEAAVSSCPEENVLVQFARGGAREAELGPLETHLDGCEACRRAVAAAASEHTLPSLPSSQELRPGMRVARYEIERELGRGGMGVVYQARDVTLDRRVALKLLHARRDVESQTRLLREAQVMAKLAHPNVVPVFELGEWAGDLYLVMELVAGTTLEAWLKSAPRSAQEILKAFFDAGQGLAAAHAAGVVHRDFKPANVLMGVDGRVRVTDFGLSRPCREEALPPVASPLVTRDGALVGTVAYMAPEQLDGQPADERSDQFAFCVALAEALSGTRPFPGDSWSTLATSMTRAPKLSRRISGPVRRVLRRGLSREPQARFTSMASLLDALEQTRRPTARRLVAASLGAALAASLVLVPGLIQTWRTRTSPPTLEVPSAEPPRSAEIMPVPLEVGEVRVLTFPEILGFSVGDANVASVKARQGESNQVSLLLVGVGVGRTSVEVKTAARVERLEVIVHAAAKARPAEPAIERRLALREGDTRTLRIPGVTHAEATVPGVIEATVVEKDRVVLRAVGSGTTNVLMTTAKDDTWWTVVVSEASRPVTPNAPEPVQRVFSAHIKEIARCYEAQLESSPRLEGKIVLGLKVSAEGTVDNVQLESSETQSGSVTDVAACILQRVRGWQFPKSPAGYSVSYPIALRSN